MSTLFAANYLAVIIVASTKGILSTDRIAALEEIPSAPVDDGTRFHSLRHSCAALLVEAGAHPKLVQSQLGHSSIRTTMDQYAFVMPGLDDRLAERLDEVLSEALAPQERPRAINA